MNQKNLRFLILGILIGIILTLIIVRITDLVMEDQIISDDDLMSDYNGQIEFESTTSAI